MHTELGALKLFSICADVPVKSMTALRVRTIDLDADHDALAIVHLVAKLPAPEPSNDPAHAFLRIVLHVLHVGAHQRQSVLCDHALELRDPLLIGGDLRFEVGEVLSGVA